MREKISAAVFGGKGFTGSELCRLLLTHPQVGRIFPTSRGQEDFDRANPNLKGSGLSYLPPEEMLTPVMVNKVDVAFFCTPTGEAMKFAPTFLSAGKKVIDLSADFRFKSAATFEEAHHMPHSCPELLDQAVYGITEFNRDKIKSASLLSNPGCYVITTMLGLYPLLRGGLIDTSHVPVFAINGTTGGSSKPEPGVMHSRVFGNVLAYNMEGHRHSWELEDVVESITGLRPMINFNTQHGNFARGIHVVSSPLSVPEHRAGMSRDSLLELFNQTYSREPFIRVVDFPRLAKGHTKEYDIYPQIRNVVGTNFCDIGLDYDPHRGIVKVISVTDNLVKGAAGSAIQNMNVMFGFDETSGLRSYSAC